MSIEKTVIKCEAVFDNREPHQHRFMWKRVWDKDKPLACIIMLNPANADCLIYDTTSYLVQNNVASLDIYGGVVIVNIYSKITSKLNLRWDSDEELNDSENDTHIKKAVAECDIVILAWGTGALTNKRVLGRIKDVLALLKPFKEKLHVITDGDELRAVHPLTPAVRNEWILKPFEDRDIEPNEKSQKAESSDTIENTPDKALNEES